MVHWIDVRNSARGGHAVVRARWCATFASRLRGWTFRRSAPGKEGLLLVEAGEGRWNTAIHMWFVFQPLGVIWLDGGQRVVDRRVAQPWRWYRPKRPARYVLEGSPELLEEFSEGDTVVFESV